MCGIVGFTGKKQAAPILIDGLSRLEYRGYDSAGIAVIESDSIQTSKTKERIDSLRQKTDNGSKTRGTVGIGHTRWATHGAPSETNAHPHLSGDGKIAVVHNGIIENYAKLREELIKEGVVFKSETDTEVVPHLVSKYYKGDLLEAVLKAQKRLEGSFALGIISTENPDKIIAVKKFSPLILGLSKEGNFIASDVTAVVSHTKDIIYLEDGETAVLTPETVEVYNADGKKTDKKVASIDWDVSAAEKGGYDHFMMKEIVEQPDVVKRTVESRIKNGRIELEGIKIDTERLKQFTNIMIIACGSAYHAGIVGKYVFEEVLRIPAAVDLASEFRYRNPVVDEKTLTIVISQSGETADTLAALKEAQQRGSYVLSVVNVVGSSIAKASDDVIYTWAGPEIAVATTKGFSTQLAVLYLIALWMAEKTGKCGKEELKNLTDEILKLPEKIKSIIDESEKIKELAKKCGDPQSLFFIGRNIDYAVSLEASLKLKEISYIHSEAYAAGELKHGTISLIEEGRTVVALACCKEFFDKMMSNVKEVKARGANVLACAFEGNTDVEREASDVMYVPETNRLFAASVEVIPFQIYAYYVALFKGCDIDKPRNLAKSVTVE